MQQRYPIDPVTVKTFTTGQFWAMAGENQDFTDMDAVSVDDLR